MPLAWVLGWGLPGPLVERLLSGAVVEDPDSSAGLQAALRLRAPPVPLAASPLSAGEPHRSSRLTAAAPDPCSSAELARRALRRAIVSWGFPMRMETAACALLCVAAAPLAWAQRSATARETTPDALQEMLDRGEKVLVIDVRTDEEVKAGSIPGAIHIPMDQLEAQMKDVPKDIQLVFT